MRVRQVRELDSDTAAAVDDLARAAAWADRVYPLDEGAVLRLRHRAQPPPVHLLADAGAGQPLDGYAQLNLADGPEGPDGGSGATGELVVHPRARRRGVGRALATAALEVTGAHDPAGRLRLWAHGDHPGAAALAASLGFTRTRVLYQLRRSLTGPVDEPVLPAGVTLRTFRPGRDDDRWLALNARAFASHPERGRWTRHDLRLRMAEPWFDPAGFLLAEREGRLVGFHWTKVHAGDGDRGPIGEVYVLGVDPAAHSAGLGTALTLAGLRHLRQRGMDRVMLYVDGANRPAVALYTRLGFTRWSADVTYARAARD